ACSAVPLASKSSALSIAQFFSMRVKIQNLALFIALLLIWHAVFSLLGLYDSGRLSSRRAECLRIIKATSIGTLFILVAARFLNITMVTPSFIVIFWVVGSCTTLLARLIIRILMERARIKGRNLRYMLIIGTNRRAVEFARKIETRAELGYRILGFVDDDWAGLQEFQNEGYQVA